jgi:hypothetical protein
MAASSVAPGLDCLWIGREKEKVSCLIGNEHFQLAVAATVGTTTEVRDLQALGGNVVPVGSHEAQREGSDFTLGGIELRHVFVGRQTKVLVQLQFVVSDKSRLVTQVSSPHGLKLPDSIKTVLPNHFPVQLGVAQQHVACMEKEPAAGPRHLVIVILSGYLVMLPHGTG